MTVKDEYEYLKTELMIQLSDATTLCALDGPFGFKLPKEEEEDYFPLGTEARLVTKKAFIIFDNTYKKIRLYPTEEFIQILRETAEDIYKDYKKSVMEAYVKQQLCFKEQDYLVYDTYIDSFINKLKEHVEPYIKELDNLTPEQVEKEINMKDKVKEAEDKSLIKFNKDNPNGLF